MGKLKQALKLLEEEKSRRKEETRLRMEETRLRMEEKRLRMEETRRRKDETRRRKDETRRRKEETKLRLKAEEKLKYSELKGLCSRSYADVYGKYIETAEYFDGKNIDLSGIDPKKLKKAWNSIVSAKDILGNGLDEKTEVHPFTTFVLQEVFNEFGRENLKFHYEANLINPNLRPDFSITLSSIAQPSWQDCISFIECKSSKVSSSSGGQAITYLSHLMSISFPSIKRDLIFSVLTTGFKIQFFILVKNDDYYKPYYTSNFELFCLENHKIPPRGFELLCQLVYTLSNSGISPNQVSIGNTVWNVIKTLQRAEDIIVGVIDFGDEEGLCVAKSPINMNKSALFSIRKEALMYNLLKDSPVRTLSLSKRSNSEHLIFKDVCHGDLRSWTFEMLKLNSVAFQKIIPCYLEIFDQIKAMHDLGYTHADIRPANVLILETGLPCLIDFVTATKHGEIITWLQGTLIYMADELLNLKPPYLFKKKFDMESFCYLMLDCADIHFVNSFLRPRTDDVFDFANVEVSYAAIRQERLRLLRHSVDAENHFVDKRFVTLFFNFFDKLNEISDDLINRNYIELRQIISSFI
jgi:hypothetical protein